MAAVKVSSRNETGMKLINNDFDWHFNSKISDRESEQRFDAYMTSLSTSYVQKVLKSHAYKVIVDICEIVYFKNNSCNFELVFILKYQQLLKCVRS